MEKVLSMMMLGVITCVLALFFKKDTEYIGLILTIIAGVIILIFAINLYNGLFLELKNLIASLGINDFLDVGVLKAIGIALLTRITSEICRDAGGSGLAAKIEFLGIASAIFVLLPLVSRVLSLINGML